MLQNVSIFQEEYNRLNSEQRKAVDTIDGALLVLAGPGTGKTQLLSLRASNILLKKQISPENILILSFTNVAARAMRERLALIIGSDGYNIEVETFHSFANSIVLESVEATKYIKDKIEISEIEKVRTIEYILDNVKGVEALRPFGSPYIHRKEIEKRLSELKNEGISPEEFKDSLKSIKSNEIDFEDKHFTRLKALALIYEHYEKLKDEKAPVLFDERGRIDYDDMILVALNALKHEKELVDIFRKRFKYIMVDEYQDTNSVQLELLFTILNPEELNICCVGDDDQAIYRFQGATLANFHKLRESLSSLKTICLKDNYRSSPGIIDLSDRLISHLPSEERIMLKELNSRRTYAKENIRFLEFMTEEEELAFIVGEIRKEVEIIKNDPALADEERSKPLNNIAVLVRKRDQILKVIDALLKAGISYATDGEEDIRQEKRVRQMLDILELASMLEGANDKKSLILYKILTSDYIDASLQDVLRFIDYVNEKKSGLFQQFMEHFVIDDSDTMPTPEGSKKLKITHELSLKKPHALHAAAWAITRLLIDAGNQPVHDLLLKYIEDVGLYKFILSEYEKDEILRLRDLRALVSFINVIKTADLANPALGLGDFMKELELRDIHGMPIQGELATLNQDGVRIYTVHKSKGLEFYTVFMPFCLAEKSWPVKGKPDVVSLPLDIYKTGEKHREKKERKLLNFYDELRLFYVASTRAKTQLIYTATPREKVITSPFLSYLEIKPEVGSPTKEEEFLREFLTKNTRKDPFLGVLPQILKDMVSRIVLNPTSLNNYIQCKRKFFYDNVLMLPGRKTQQLTFGNCAHKALEEVYTIFMEKKKFPKFEVFKNTFRKEIQYQGVSNAIKGICLDKLEELEEWYNEEARALVMPIELENKLEINIAKGIVFRGTFDKIEKESENTIRVIDYKTGKPDEHVKRIANCRKLSEYQCDDYFRQLVAYKLLYERSQRFENTKYIVAKGVLQFLEKVSDSVKKYNLVKGEYHREIIDLTDDMVKEFEEMVVQYWQDIQSLRFEKLPERDEKERCIRCAFDSICWG